jgi:hypothetical protein
MKAESIEQIREHLAKGGRALAVLKDGRTDEVKRVDMGMLRVYAGIWSSSFACVDVDHWQLLPLEEKEPVPVDHGTPSREWLEKMADIEDKCSVSVGGMAADNRMLPGLCEVCGVGFLLPSGRCVHCNVLAVDQDVSEGVPGAIAALPDGTQKGQEERFRDSQKERMQRIRQRLLHGMWPEMSDLLAWWEATTGERIEHGKRCEKCNGTGKSLVHCYDGCPPMESPCPFCKNGYSVRPTWMETQ